MKVVVMGLIMYILTTLEFPKHNHDFHLLTTSVSAKYYYYTLVTLTWQIRLVENGKLYADPKR